MDVDAFIVDPREKTDGSDINIIGPDIKIISGPYCDFGLGVAELNNYWGEILKNQNSIY